MKKTVNYKGKKIKVDFLKGKFTVEFIQKKTTKTPGKSQGTDEFIINGKSYTVFWYNTFKNSASIKLRFEEFSCGDSEKKIIEYIINKYGIE